MEQEFSFTALIFPMLIAIVMIAAVWKVFTKAGQPGWAAIVPIYNIYVMTQIAKKPSWWIAIILLVPIVNFIFLIMVLNGISKGFGKSAGFTAGLIFLGIIFWPILGFGSAVYNSENLNENPA